MLMWIFFCVHVSRRCWNRSTTWKNCGWITTLYNLYQGWENVQSTTDHVFGFFPLSSLRLILSLSSHLFHLQSIGKLRQLRYLDLAKNRIETLDADISGCEALEDLLLSSNMLQQLPDTIGTHTNSHIQILSEASEPAVIEPDYLKVNTWVGKSSGIGSSLALPKKSLMSQFGAIFPSSLTFLMVSYRVYLKIGN